jgi:hypothetical protein
MTAGQATADEAVSPPSETTDSVIVKSVIAISDGWRRDGVVKSASMVKERKKDDDRDWHAEKPKQNSATHGSFPCSKLRYAHKTVAS